MRSAAALTSDRSQAVVEIACTPAARAVRGRPLIMLGVLGGAWVLARVALWETPLPQAPKALGSMSTQIFAGDAPAPFEKSGENGSPLIVTDAAAIDAKPAEGWPFQIYNASGDAPETLPTAAPTAVPSVSPFLPPASAAEMSAGDLQTAASHQLMFMAAIAYLPVPKAVRSALASNRTSQAGPFAIGAGAGGDKSKPDRWSLDAWTFWRQGSASPLIALGQNPSYGASQAGAVLRYELQPSNARRPRAYVRGYSSLEGRTEQEVAAGLSAKPLPRLPLRLHAEARALRSARGTSTRAAAFVTTEIPPVKLPAGFTGEAYGQAGYVTGKNKTPFADGQAHVLREVASFDLAKIEVGGAAFAGAQKGAHRVDIGPAMRINLSLGETPARLSASYRAKIAGDAQPSSGVAVTLSTRF